jgi:hypothetical protein
MLQSLKCRAALDASHALFIPMLTNAAAYSNSTFNSIESEQSIIGTMEVYSNKKQVPFTHEEQ